MNSALSRSDVRCLDPAFVRAAASRSLTDVELSTFVDQETLPELKVHASAYGVSLITLPCNLTTSFHYSHPLAIPEIRPRPGGAEAMEEMRISGDSVLVFGMLEGTPKVSGKRVVYDPQSPDSPTPWGASWMSGEQLAVVLNEMELRRIAGDFDGEIDTVARKVIDGYKHVLLVVKRGPRGARVYAEGAVKNIPAFRTARVWKIGSGDVFASAFAVHWARFGLDPFEAAQRASAAAAWYCGNGGVLPLDPGYADIVKNDFQELTEIVRTRKPYVYLAGPFFTMSQRWLINEARRSLRDQHLDVFSPFHDVGLGKAEEVVEKDLVALRSADAVFAIVDGTDTGTVFEVGYAAALGKRVVAFVQNEPEEAMKMLSGSGCILCDDFTTAIYHTSWAAGFNR